MKRGMAILQELDNLMHELADARQGIVRHVHVCAGTAAITQFLPPLLAEYGELRPEVQVELEEQVSQQVVATVREGRADLGVFVAGAAMLQAQQQAAMEAGRPLKLRMQVRSFDAVGHMVASGLGIAALPKGAALPIARAMKLQWRPLADAWAVRQLQVAIRPDADATVVALRDFLLPTSQTAKSGRTKLK